MKPLTDKNGIRHEPAECDCDYPDCHYLHSPGWWVGPVSFETAAEAQQFLEAQCALEGHVFEMEGPPPWKCTFCGYTPKLEG